MKKEVLMETETGEIFAPETPKFKTQWNAKLFPKDGERNVLPSLAVPDQSLSISEIIKRHTRGLPIFGNEMAYGDAFDPLGGRNINSLDIEEVWSLANMARTKYRDAQDKFMAEEKIKQHNRVKEATIAEYKKTLEKAQVPSGHIDKS